MGWSSIMLNLAGRGGRFRFCLQRERLVEEKKRVQTRLASRLSLVGEDGFEPSKHDATDLQSAPFGHSGILPYWSWWTDLNPRPADYKSAALPTELHQRIATIVIISLTAECVNA